MTKPLDRELKEKLIQPILSALEPMLIIELEEFAEEYIQLLTVRTPWKGKLSLENSPYMCGEWGPLWAWKRYEYISNIWGTQTGKTTILFIILCYIAKVDCLLLIMTMKAIYGAGLIWTLNKKRL